MTDNELDTLLRQHSLTRSVDVTSAVMHRVKHTPYLMPSHPLRRRRMAAVAAVACLLLSTSGIGYSHYQNRLADQRIASMFTSVYNYHND